MQKDSTIFLMSASTQEHKKYNDSKYIVILAEHFKVEHDYFFLIHHSMLCIKVISIGGVAIALNSVK